MQIYEKVSLDDSLPIKFLNLDIKEDETEVVVKHWHRSLEIVVPIRGSIKVWASGVNTTVNSGEIYIINTEEIHSIYPNKDECYKGYVIQISYDYLKECYSEIDSIYFEQVYNEEIVKQIIDCIKEIDNDYKLRDEHSVIKIKSSSLLLIYILLTNQKVKRSDAKIVNSHKHRKRIIEMVNYIGENYREDITVELLAEKFNISYGHLSRLFKEHLNTTVKDYIIKVRLNNAKHNLINSDYPVIQVAFDNGFPNVQSFYKSFKREYSVTPAEYRRNIIK